MRILKALAFLCLFAAATPAAAAEKEAFDAKPLLAWSEKAAAQTYSFSFLTFDNDMAEASKNFTPKGWDGFKSALQSARITESVQAQHQLVTTIVVKPPALTKRETVDGVTHDFVEMTIAAEYQSGADMHTEYMKLDLDVEEAKTPAFAIAQWIATPVEAPPSTIVMTTTKIENAPSRLCGEVGKMQQMLMQQRHLAFLGTAIDSSEVVHIYFRSNIDERWAEMEMDDNLQACIVREGYDFHFLMGGHAPEIPAK